MALLIRERLDELDRQELAEEIDWPHNSPSAASPLGSARRKQPPVRHR